MNCKNSKWRWISERVMQLVKYVEVRRMEETMLPIEEGIAHHKGDHHFKQGH